MSTPAVPLLGGRSRALVRAVLALGVVGLAIAFLAAAPLAEAAFDGRGPGLLVRKVESHRSWDPVGRDRAYFVSMFRGVFGRLLIGGVLGAGLFGWLVGSPAAAARLRGYFLARHGPWNLALLRIAVLGMMLASLDPARLRRYAAFPPELANPPVPWGTMLPWAGFTPARADLAMAAFVVVAALGILGVRARWMCGLAAVLGTWVFGLEQVHSKVSHYNHWIWFLLILAASPCGDVLSWDAWRRRRAGAPAPGPSRAYGFPLRLIWLLVGVIYFFPGLWKLVTSGVDWALGDNLALTLYQKWFQEARFWTPLYRLDRFPILMAIGGMWTLAFEVLFLPALFHPASRRALVGAAVVFHVNTGLAMNIWFEHLWPLYPILFVRWGERPPAAPGAPDALREPTPRPALLVGGALLLVNGLAGVGQVYHGWPFACFPSFSARSSAFRYDLVVEARGPGGWGPLDSLPLQQALDRSRYYEIVRVTARRLLAEDAGGPARLAAFVALWRELAPVAAGTDLRVQLERLTVVPEERAGNPLSRRLVGEFPAPQP